MDPYVTLRKAREAAKAIRSKEGNGHTDTVDVMPDLYDVLEAFEDLDDWLSKGGFSPWKSRGRG